MPEAKIQSSNYLTDILGPDRLMTFQAYGVLMLSLMCVRKLPVGHATWPMPYNDLVSGRPLTPGLRYKFNPFVLPLGFSFLVVFS